ncbi:MAG: leucine-rich repeat domain-containing protein [Promethearchaeota archaeon]
MTEKEFHINEYLTLRLEEPFDPRFKRLQTAIYVGGRFFRQCKFLLLNIPVEKIKMLDEIDSIDEAAERLDKSQEPVKGYVPKIPPEVEFWGHCSNLQVWYEYDYDTRLLHSNLAFPLLKKLAEAGDPLAKQVFREEIAKRLESNYPPVVEYLKKEGYLKYLSHEDLLFSLLNAKEAEAILDIEKIIGKQFEILFEIQEGKTESYLIIKNKHVETIALCHRGISNVPKELRNFKYLKELDIGGDQITELPEWISEFKNLKYLFIGGNQITSLPEWIRKLKKLKYIDISYNPIEILPEAIFHLKKLKHIEAEVCPIKKIPDPSSGDISEGLKGLFYYLKELKKEEKHKN